jgi:transposase
MHATSQPSRAISIEQTSAGFAALQHKLQTIEPDPRAILIVMEATGTYWMRLASSLVAAGFAVAAINPPGTLWVPHDFAKALLKRSKTDAIDAQTLAMLGARLQPECWTPPPPVYTELQQRLVHRDGDSWRHARSSATSCTPCSSNPS